MAETVAVLYEAAKGERKTIVPGYTGYIPHAAEVAGRSQVRTAARCAVHSGEELATADALPSDPVNKSSLVRVEQAYTSEVLGRNMSATLIGSNELMPRHISGYTGHVSGLRDCALGKSFGAVTGETLGGHSPSPKRDRVAMMKAISPASRGYPFTVPRTKPAIKVSDPSLYLHYQ